MDQSVQQGAGQGAVAAQSSPEGSDLSGKTVLSLVVLTLVVSFIGAWASISQVMTASLPAGVSEPPSSQGKVSFSIKAPPETSYDATTGMVAFGITPPDGQGP